MGILIGHSCSLEAHAWLCSVRLYFSCLGHCSHLPSKPSNYYMPTSSVMLGQHARVPFLGRSLVLRGADSSLFELMTISFFLANDIPFFKD